MMLLGCTSEELSCRLNWVVLFCRTVPLDSQATCGTGKPNTSGQVSVNADSANAFTAVGPAGLSLRKAAERQRARVGADSRGNTHISLYTNLHHVVRLVLSICL